jgi:hypothetical protein
VKRGKWSFAHLPVIPPHFDLAPIDKAKTRLNAVVKLVKRKDVTALINACDAGREGELIFRLIVQYAAGGKAAIHKPIQRLWLQSMTPQAIRDGFDSLRSDKELAGLSDAARSRSEADWLVGINGTRRDDGVQLARRRLFPDDGGPGPDAHALDRRRARRKDPQACRPRLLGDQGQLRRPGRRVRGQMVRSEVEEESRRRPSCVRTGCGTKPMRRPSPKRCGAKTPA